MFPCEFCEISKNTFFYRTPVVAASEDYKLTISETESQSKWSILNNIPNFCWILYSNIFRIFILVPDI